MDRWIINQLVESYINGKSEWQLPDTESLAGASELFEIKTAKRLKRAFDLYSVNRCYYGDFLLAFRNYLLVLQVHTLLERIDIPADNGFGIAKDYQSNKYFASYQSPVYVNSSFVETVFMHKKTNQSSQNDTDLHTDPFIRSLTGYKYFKSTAQKLAVYGALNTPDGYTTLVSLPTGGGKSLITQTMSYQRDGLTIVVVPTVSLAIDQVRVAKEIIRSENIDEEVFSYNSGIDARPILKAIKSKKAKMLFISPEALINNSGFIEVVDEANTARYLKNIIIDEAHIVVDWGASFRIDYQCLESWRKKLMLSNPNIRTILLSATFEQHCISILKTLFSQGENNWIEIRCDSLRHEPRYSLVKSKSFTDKTKKMIELVKKMPQPMIIYVARPDDAVEIASVLSRHGIKNVKTFTGLTTTSRRKELIDAWVDDQFEIMVATSAFGVGVDKADVRTVLHMYIPQNPNAYYQELGRGGRDRLPCLSIMCIYPDDINIAFGRISKKVMTTEKIVGRWNSMYNSECSKRIGNYNYIDTSVKPNYATKDIWDDSPTSDADMNWNIYVILFLRRYGLISINEVIPQQSKYIFVIEIQEDQLRIEGEQQNSLIEKLRSLEWTYYEETFQAMKSAIKNSDTRCWSEMFYETYDRVSEYCAGCNAHSIAVESDFMDYPLKVPVASPLVTLANDQLELFGGSDDVVFIPASEEKAPLFKGVGQLRISAFISESTDVIENCLCSMVKSSKMLVLNPKDLKALVKKKSFYYLSGIIAVYYSGSPKEIYELLKFSMNNLSRHLGTKVIHIIDENQYFDWLDKAFVDLVAGPVVPVKALSC